MGRQAGSGRIGGGILRARMRDLRRYELTVQGEDGVCAMERFQTMAASACARLHALGSPSGEAAQHAILTASRATGFLEALNLVAPAVAQNVAGDAARLEEALSTALARFGPEAMGHRASTPW